MRSMAVGTFHGMVCLSFGGGAVAALQDWRIGVGEWKQNSGMAYVLSVARKIVPVLCLAKIDPHIFL